MYFDINTALNQFRSQVEDKIRSGIFDNYGRQAELFERSSYVYSDIRAQLLQIVKRHNSEQHKNKFTLQDIENVADITGNGIKEILSRAYVTAARKASSDL